VSYTGLYRLVWWIIIAIEAANCGRFIHKKEANRIANPIVGFENPHMFRGRYLTWSGFFMCQLLGSPTAHYLTSLVAHSIPSTKIGCQHRFE
jgi:hypothetical protein